MLNLNKVFLLGNLTKDPELRYLPSGTAIVSFGLATNRKFKSADGEQKAETCFVDVKMFGRRGEIISEYLSKGSPIYVEGRLRFEQWETQDGQKRSKLVVMADNFEFAGGPKGSEVGFNKEESLNKETPPDDMMSGDDKSITDSVSDDGNMSDVPF